MKTLDNSPLVLTVFSLVVSMLLAGNCSATRLPDRYSKKVTRLATL